MRLSSEDSAEPGNYRCDRAPYQRGMLDAVTDPLVQTTVIMSSAQIGKSTLMKAIIGFHIDQDPSPILLVNPTEAMAETFSKDRLAPMLRDTPALRDRIADPRSRDTGNTMLYKRFPGGHLTMIGANAPSSLAARPIRVVLCDEVDRYPPSAGTEGDPVNLAIKRTATFHNRRIILTSTPTIKGFSRIETAYEHSDQRRFQVPCPHCGEFQVLRWANIVWDEGRPETAHYACDFCGAAIEEGQKGAMLRAGRWVAEAEFKGIAGFHLNELATPWRRWSEVVDDFLKARKSPETLKTWVNTSLGETWEETAEGRDPAGLLERRENYTPTTLPRRVLYLTAGVDVQGDRLELEIVGWRMDGPDYPPESWGVDYIVIPGDPAKLETWQQLDYLLAGEWRTEDGRSLRLGAVCIDSGGHHTAQVYAFCEARVGRSIFAIKGMAGKAPIWAQNARRSRRYQAKVWHVGSEAGKETWYARLRIKEEGPGYCHFPLAYDQRYFEGLTAERVRTKFVRGHAVREWFLPSGRRNEPLDIRVYSLAALLSRPVPWARLGEEAGAPWAAGPAPKAFVRRVRREW